MRKKIIFIDQETLTPEEIAEQQSAGKHPLGEEEATDGQAEKQK